MSLKVNSYFIYSFLSIYLFLECFICDTLKMVLINFYSFSVFLTLFLLSMVAVICDCNMLKKLFIHSINFIIIIFVIDYNSKILIKSISNTYKLSYMLCIFIFYIYISYTYTFYIYIFTYIFYIYVYIFYLLMYHN